MIPGTLLRLVHPRWFLNDEQRHVGTLLPGDWVVVLANPEPLAGTIGARRVTFVLTRFGVGRVLDLDLATTT